MLASLVTHTVKPPSACNTEDLSSIPGSGRSGEGNGNPLLKSLAGESHGQKSQASPSPWGRKELDITATNTSPSSAEQ